MEFLMKKLGLLNVWLKILIQVYEPAPKQEFNPSIPQELVFDTEIMLFICPDEVKLWSIMLPEPSSPISIIWKLLFTVNKFICLNALIRNIMLFYSFKLICLLAKRMNRSCLLFIKILLIIVIVE